MASLSSRLLSSLLRVTGNFNPKRVRDPVKKFQVLSSLFVNDWVPLGFSLRKERTMSGTRYDRVRKHGAAKTGRVIYFLHGGAYIGGLFGIYRDFSRGFYQAAQGCEIIFLDYSLAPKAQYPTQLQEALDVWEELTQRQGYLPENILVAGDSAGANLTLALMQKLRDSGKPMPGGGICISLWGDMTGSGNSYTQNFSKDVMFGIRGRQSTPRDRALLLNSSLFCFVGEADRRDPYVSPVFGDYHGFPPMFFAAGGYEMPLSDTLTVVEKLRKAHIPVECDIQPGMFHIYVVHGRMTPEGQTSYRKLLHFVRRRFSPCLSSDSRFW